MASQNKRSNDHLNIVWMDNHKIVNGFSTSLPRKTPGRGALAERQSRWQCPAIHGLHGTVGASDYDLSLFPIEMERLEKLKSGSDARKRCLSIARQTRPSGGPLSSLTRQKNTINAQPEDDLGQAFVLLASFLEEKSPLVDLDIHGANFMLRPDTGEAAITDPFMDVQQSRGAVSKACQER